MDQQTHCILVIDGKIVSRKVYTKLLESFFADKYLTLDVDTSEKGLMYCEQQPVDCVLVSNQLPDGCALDFMQELTQLRGAAREIPVLILAQENNEEEAKQAIKLGAYDYHVKGRFSQVTLIQSVKNAMEAARLHRELAKSSQRLLENTHKAGMAEIANGVLHNIGNNMNSVATSVETITTTMERSRMRGLRQANALLATLEGVLEQHPKGLDLLRYYRILEEKYEEERKLILYETSLLQERVIHIRSDIFEQTRYANVELFLEELNINKILADALHLQKSRMDEEGVVLEERYHPLPDCMAVRVKLVFILNNLIKNSIENMAKTNPKELIVGTRRDDENYYSIYITDNGPSIASEDQDKVFSYGFSACNGSHGAGLHMAVNAATEMGGKLSLSSEGEGVTFTLRMPLPCKILPADEGN